MKKLALLLIVSSWLVATSLTMIHQLFNNTLKNNGQWQVGKLSLQKGVMGAENFFTETQALNGLRLNLGAWHGFQEVMTEKNFEFDRVKFEVKFSENSYLFFYYQADEGQRLALRFEPISNQVSCLKIEKSGKFLDPVTTHDLVLPLDRWLKVAVTNREHQIVSTIDGKEISCPATIAFPTINSQIGFKNGLQSVLIDNVSLSKNEEIVFSENFSLQARFGQSFWLIFIPMASAEILLLKLIKGKKTNSNKTGFFLILINLTLLVSAIIAYFYLFFYFTGNYPNLASIFNRWQQQDDIDWSRVDVIILSRQLNKQYLSDANEKIMFIGSSQTWGAGASDVENTFVNRVQVALTQQPLTTNSTQVLGLTTDRPVVVNTGISGTVSEILLEKYKNDWSKLNPELVVINLSNNDFEYGIDGALFRQNLQAFVDLNNSLKIRTVLLLEATAKEYHLDNPFHQIVKEVAEKNNLQLINTHQMMQEKNDTGQLWWDFIHPTDYGHQLLGEYIAEQLLTSTPSSQLNPGQTSPQTP